MHFLCASRKCVSTLYVNENNNALKSESNDELFFFFYDELVLPENQVYYFLVTSVAFGVVFQQVCSCNNLYRKNKEAPGQRLT